MAWTLPSPRTPLALALQGGGAHGAFTWGVLDALLEDGRFDVRALSGTSAGAMNALALAHGLLQVQQVLGLEGVRRVVRERAVQLEVQVNDVQRQPRQQRIAQHSRGGAASHAVTGIDHDLEPAQLR